jgi:Anthrone oxygenase
MRTHGIEVHGLLEIVSVVLAALTLAPALAHVCELPGKLRLDRDGYLTVQSIYYPGFTLIGMSEPLAVLASLALALVSPPALASFWLALAACACFLGMQAIFWAVVQPVNKRWLEGKQLPTSTATFFAVGGRREASWKDLRDRWEHAHAARAALALLGLIALLLAMRAGP